MIPWFLENLERVAQERRALDALGSEPWFRGHAWRLNRGGLSVEVEIDVRGRVHALRLDYPPVFPSSVPTVTPVGEPERVSGHQYGAAGELCLEWGPDNWHPSVTGSQLIESANRLIEGESARTAGEEREIPDRHEATLGQEIRAWRRFVVGPEVRQRLNKLARPTTAQFRALFEGECLLTHLGALRPDDDELRWPNPEVPPAILSDGWDVRGFALPTQQQLLRPGAVKDSELRAYLAVDGLSALLDDQPGSLGFVWAHPSEGLAFAHRIGKPGSDFHVSDVVEYSAPNSAQRTPFVYEDLADRKVAIVGLGSIGAHIALSLARTGVRNFLLVDDDIVLPENLVRHALDWRSVGSHKVDATAAALHRIASGISIKTEKHSLDGQRATAGAAAVDAAIAAADVVVNATASADGFNRLARVAAQSKTPVVWAEVFGGGIGGMIARSRPGHDPDPFTMRRQIALWTLEQDTPVPEVVGDYEARGADDTPWVATDADVRAIAAHASALVLDTLRSDAPASAYPSNVYFIGLREGWIFSQPFDVRPVNLACSPEKAPAADLDAVKEGVDLITGLLSDCDDSNSTSS